MKPDFREQVRRRLLLYDGGMGTMLFAAGLLDGESPEPWNWEKPEVVNTVYRAYYEAGSDVVQTNTFGGTSIKLSEVGLADRTYDANYLAAKALKAICPEGRRPGDSWPLGRGSSCGLTEHAHCDARRAPVPPARVELSSMK